MKCRLLFLIILMSIYTLHLFSSFNALESLTVTVSLDKTEANRGEIVTITGDVTDSEGMGVANAFISIQVDKPDGSLFHVAMLVSSVDGSFTDQFTIPEEVENGIYNVYITVSKSGFGDTSIQITYTVIPEFQAETMSWLILIAFIVTVFVIRCKNSFIK